MLWRLTQEASRLAVERARDQLELEVSAMQARVQEEERECAEQARRARQLKEEVVDQMGRVPGC